MLICIRLRSFISPSTTNRAPSASAAPSNDPLKKMFEAAAKREEDLRLAQEEEKRKVQQAAQEELARKVRI